jgi:hypothetical protein
MTFGSSFLFVLKKKKKVHSTRYRRKLSRQPAIPRDAALGRRVPVSVRHDHDGGFSAARHFLGRAESGPQNEEACGYVFPIKPVTLYPT